MVFLMKVVFSRSVMKCVGILMGTALSGLIAFGKMLMLSMLILLTHEHGRSSRLLISSSITFFNVLKFLSYKSFPRLVTPKIFYII